MQKNAIKCKTVKYRVKLLISTVFIALFMVSGCGNENPDGGPASEGKTQSAAGSLPGEGTRETPFKIQTADELVQFARDVNEGNTFTGQYVTLVNDMDLSSVDNWEMIGTADGNAAFAGIFDGAGHKITNLTCKNDAYAGFFALLNGMVVNLRIEDSTIEANTCGAIAAVTTENAVIANCYSTASVNGETAGGMAGSGTATYINCANLATEEMGVQGIVADTEGSTLMNCYTNRGGSFELENHTSDEVELGNQTRAVQNLNSMLGELSVKYEIAHWYRWEMGDTRPVLSDEKAVLISGVTKEDGTASSYDTAAHAWVFPELKSTASDPIKLSIQLTDGTAREVTCDARFEELHYTMQGIETLILCRQDETPETDTIIFADTDVVEIDLSAQMETPQSDAVEFIPIAYLDESGTVDGENTLVKIAQPGKFKLKGKLTGQVLVDLGADAIADGNKQAELELDQVEIKNTYGPAMKIENVLETGDTTYAGIRIKLADGSVNTLDGSNSMNIYGDGDASEGAVSTRMTMSISGDTGKLMVISDLEGIESKTRLRLQGGGYDINSAEDGLNISEDLEIADCYLVIHAADDVMDSDGEMNVNATIIGSTSVEHFFNARDGVDVDGVFIVGTSSFTNAAKDGSEQGLVNVKSNTMYQKGEKIVVTDEQDNPVFAFEVQQDAGNMVFSFPGMVGSTLHIYACDSITGTFQDGVCHDVTAFEKRTSFTHDGVDTFAITGMDNQFELDTIE
ncbi:MAG: carbohydrate-binding domain-containing protein [Lachnospiraceae bacterium]|nr:carbohydrate-binding domain-containing protein [Lachnospiraceae bacterium]